jgi:hypothetical protein
MATDLYRPKPSPAEKCRLLVLDKLSRRVSIAVIDGLIQDGFDFPTIAAAFDQAFQPSFLSLDRMRRLCTALRYAREGNKRLQLENQRRDTEREQTRRNEEKLKARIIERARGIDPAQVAHAFAVITNVCGHYARSKWLRAIEADEDWSFNLISLVQHVDDKLAPHDPKSNEVKMSFWKMYRAAHGEEAEPG